MSYISDIPHTVANAPQNSLDHNININSANGIKYAISTGYLKIGYVSPTTY
jgi:hypothetical protein